MGSVFSPYYARARRRRDPDPTNHCALNVALYSAGAKRWCLTERGRKAVSRSPGELHLGPSAVTWNGRWLQVDVDEFAAPLPRRLRGRIRVHPAALSERQFALDAGGRHHWWPASPRCTVEVRMENPALAWQGKGYLDANWGSEPLEAGFARWDWSRAELGDGASTVLYDVTPRQGDGPSLALHFDTRGGITEFPAPPVAPLPKTSVWRVPRSVQSEHGPVAGVVRTLEDTPFYARSLVRTRVRGESVLAMHESLSLERFSRRWVQLLLPFRMPRIAGL